MTSESSQKQLSGPRRRAIDAYRRAYGDEPEHIIVAPGRVNLIGEHTDYNDGFVLPAAIDRHVVLAISPREDRTVRLYAADFSKTAEFALDDIQPDADQRWSNYERGVAWALQGAGHELRGMDVAISSDVPIASGLSSSAALEMATARAFEVASGLTLDGVTRALLGQKAENEFVGMRCGIMDQYIISLGQRDHALLIDCRSLEYQLVSLPSGYSLVICDTKKRRGLVDSEYNTRRQECEEGARILGVPALRDVDVDTFAERADALPPIVRQRCKHIVTENQRVMDAVQALGEGNVGTFGRLMDASHASLRDDYQVSCHELDVMVEIASRQEGVVGSRMTGAGFGGCTITLVESDADAIERFRANVQGTYAEQTGLQPEIYVCRAEQGVHVL